MEKQGTPFVTGKIIHLERKEMRQEIMNNPYLLLNIEISGDFATMGHKITSNTSQEMITEQCWPDCAASSENIIVVVFRIIF